MKAKPGMRKVELPLLEVGLVAGTRAMAGAGTALLHGDKLAPRQRRILGRTLFLAGALATMPLALDVLARSRGR